VTSRLDHPRSRPTRRVYRLACALWLLALVGAAGAQEQPEPLSLTESAREAIDSNLDLLARRRALDASRASVGLARAPLLPQADTGARAQLLDAERSDDARGNNREGSILLAAGLTQIVYDENSWAGFTMQKRLYEADVAEYDSARLAVVEEAAVAFVALSRARRRLEIEQNNRELTKQNLEKSRARIATGWSSEREVLRWETQLAGNDIDVRSATVGVLQATFELNRVRNRPLDGELEIAPATLDDYGFVFADEDIAAASTDGDADRRMRDYFVRVGLDRSPEIQALDGRIAAAERQLTASKRVFWAPTLSVAAGVDYLANESDDASFNQTEWGVKGILAYPLARGGGRLAALDQSRADVGRLRTQRRATSLGLDQSIRGAFAQAAGSFFIIEAARRQEDAASRNFDLVDQSYTLGVASILDLLDAQSQLLDAELALADSTYGFLDDVMVLERTIAFYPFLEPPDEEEAMIQGLRAVLAAGAATSASAEPPPAAGP